MMTMFSDRLTWNITKSFIVFFDSLIKSVAQEQTFSNGKYTDPIDKIANDIEKRESKIQCLHWDNGFIIYYDKSKRICDICKNNLRETNKLKLSESVPTASTSNTTTVINKVSFDGKKIKKSASRVVTPIKKKDTSKCNLTIHIVILW